MSSPKDTGTSSEEEALLQKVDAPDFSGAMLKNLLLILRQVIAIVFGIIAESLVQNERARNLSSLILFCVTVALVFVAVAYYFVLESRRSWRSCREKSMKTLAAVGHASVALGAFFYYVGDNVTGISDQFTAFGCLDACVENIEVTSRILLFVSLTCLGLLPSLVTKCWKGHSIVKLKVESESGTKPARGDSAGRESVGSGDGEEHELQAISQGLDTAMDMVQGDKGEKEKDEPEPIGQGIGISDGKEALASSFAAIALGQLVEVDAFYTAVWQGSFLANETNASTTTTADAEECQLNGLVTAGASLGLIVLLWAVFIVISVLFIGSYNTNIVNKVKYPRAHKLYVAVFVLTVLIVMLYPLPYFVGNKSLPLACFPGLESDLRFGLTSASLAAHFAVVLVLSRILTTMEEFLGKPEDKQSLITRIILETIRCICCCRKKTKNADTEP